MCGASKDSFIPASNDPTVFVDEGSYVDPEYTKYVAAAAGIPNTAADRPTNNSIPKILEGPSSSPRRMDTKKPITSGSSGIQRINNRKVGGARGRGGLGKVSKGGAKGSLG